MKKRPSNRASRERRARSHISRSSIYLKYRGAAKMGLAVFGHGWRPGCSRIREVNRMAVKTEKTRIPLQLGSELRLKPTGEISLSNPDLELEPSEAVADAVLEYT